jgi:hypothetical protein
LGVEFIKNWGVLFGIPFVVKEGRFKFICAKILTPD